MRKQSGDEWAGQVHRNTVSKQSGNTSGKALHAGYISPEDALRAFAAAAPSVCPGVVGDVFAEVGHDTTCVP